MLRGKAMQRGYVLANVALDSVVTINKKNKNFEMLLVTKSGDLNNALCFTNITAAKTIEKQIKKFDPDFPEIKIINVAQLYNKVFQ